MNPYVNGISAECARQLNKKRINNCNEDCHPKKRLKRKHVKEYMTCPFMASKGDAYWQLQSTTYSQVALKSKKYLSNAKFSPKFYKQLFLPFVYLTDIDELMREYFCLLYRFDTKAQGKNENYISTKICSHNIHLHHNLFNLPLVELLNSSVLIEHSIFQKSFEFNTEYERFMTSYSKQMQSLLKVYCQLQKSIPSISKDSYFLGMKCGISYVQIVTKALYELLDAPEEFLFSHGFFHFQEMYCNSVKWWVQNEQLILLHFCINKDTSSVLTFSLNSESPAISIIHNSSLSFIKQGKFGDILKICLLNKKNVGIINIYDVYGFCHVSWNLASFMRQCVLLGYLSNNFWESQLFDSESIAVPFRNDCIFHSKLQITENCYEGSFFKVCCFDLNEKFMFSNQYLQSYMSIALNICSHYIGLLEFVSFETNKKKIESYVTSAQTYKGPMEKYSLKSNISVYNFEGKFSYNNRPCICFECSIFPKVKISYFTNVFESMYLSNNNDLKNGPFSASIQMYEINIVEKVPSIILREIIFSRNIRKRKILLLENLKSLFQGSLFIQPKSSWDVPYKKLCISGCCNIPLEWPIFNLRDCTAYDLCCFGRCGTETVMDSHDYNLMPTIGNGSDFVTKSSKLLSEQHALQIGWDSSKILHSVVSKERNETNINNLNFTDSLVNTLINDHQNLSDMLCSNELCLKEVHVNLVDSIDAQSLSPLDVKNSQHVSTDLISSNDQIKCFSEVKSLFLCFKNYFYSGNINEFQHKLKNSIFQFQPIILIQQFNSKQCYLPYSSAECHDTMCQNSIINSMHSKEKSQLCPMPFIDPDHFDKLNLKDTLTKEYLDLEDVNMNSCDKPIEEKDLPMPLVDPDHFDKLNLKDTLTKEYLDLEDVTMSSWDKPIEEKDLPMPLVDPDHFDKLNLKDTLTKEYLDLEDVTMSSWDKPIEEKDLVEEALSNTDKSNWYNYDSCGDFHGCKLCNKDCICVSSKSNFVYKLSNYAEFKNYSNSCSNAVFGKKEIGIEQSLLTFDDIQECDNLSFYSNGNSPLKKGNFDVKEIINSFSENNVIKNFSSLANSEYAMTSCVTMQEKSTEMVNIRTEYEVLQPKQSDPVSDSLPSSKDNHTYYIANGDQFVPDAMEMESSDRGDLYRDASYCSFYKDGSVNDYSLPAKKNKSSVLRLGLSRKHHVKSLHPYFRSSRI